MKTIEELGIKQWEYDSLLKVRGNLVLESMMHVLDKDLARGHAFNMGYTGSPATELDEKGNEADCGTVCCIGGWMKVIEQKWTPNEKGFIPLDYERQNLVENYVSEAEGELHALFYPLMSMDDYSRGNWYDEVYENGFYHVEYSKITPRQAVDAIDNYLETGSANWFQVLWGSNVLQTEEEYDND